MRILISISNLQIGGAQVFAIRLIEALCSRNHSVYIYPVADVRQDREDTVIDRLSPQVKIIKFPNILGRIAIKFERILKKIGFTPRLYDLIRKLHFQSVLLRYKIEIVSSYLYHSDSFVVNVLQKSQIPIIIRAGGNYRYVVEKGIATLGEVLSIMNRVDGIVYVSQSNAEALNKYTAESKAIEKVIYNGINIPESKSYLESARKKVRIPENALIFGMVARGIAEKGWEEAIEALKLVRSSTKGNIYLILVGGSDYLDDLQKSLDVSLSSVIHFTGYCSEPNYWIKDFDIGILPTYFAGESLPNSIIEYISLSKPVIATKVGGIPEMIAYKQQQAGMLIELNQEGKADIHLMAKAMLKYVENQSLLKQHSSLAKKAFDKFKMETCVEAYESIFNQIINKAKESRGKSE